MDRVIRRFRGNLVKFSTCQSVRFQQHLSRARRPPVGTDNVLATLRFPRFSAEIALNPTESDQIQVNRLTGGRSAAGHIRAQRARIATADASIQRYSRSFKVLRCGNEPEIVGYPNAHPRRAAALSSCLRSHNQFVLRQFPPGAFPAGVPTAAFGVVLAALRASNSFQKSSTDSVIFT